MAKDRIRGDRRGQRRYPIELELDYKIIDKGIVVAEGLGRTGNMSSGGLFFQPEREISDGHSVELSIRWPAVLGNSPFIELSVTGRVVRSDAAGAAVRTNHYEFQRLGNPALAFQQLFGTALIQ